MNEILLLVEIIVVFSLVVLMHRLWGRAGLVAWCSVSLVLANIEAAKLACFGGLEVAMGNVMFASAFLANDILTEMYGEKAAKEAIMVSFCSLLAYIFCTQLLIMFEPGANDVMHGTVEQMFGIAPRVCGASIVMFLLSNFADVKIFARIKKWSHKKHLWLRNNVSTIVCNCMENFLFCFLAFGGIYEWDVIWSIAFPTSVIEAIIALCDTPFLYAAVRGGRKNGTAPQGN